MWAEMLRPVIRRFVRDSNLAMVVALDTGRNMAATAPDGSPKSEIALFAAEVICYLARNRGDTVALVACSGPVDADALRSGAATLRSWGLRVRFGATVLGRHPHLDYLADNPALIVIIGTFVRVLPFAYVHNG